MSISRLSGIRTAALAAVLFVFLVTPTSLPAWGDAGHRMIGLAAAQKLPAEMPAFFRRAAQQLAYLNPEPDRWKDRAERTLDPALEGGTSPDHYIDMDLVPGKVLRGALAAPNRWAYADSLKTVGVAPNSMGLLPFAILERSQKLRGDFRLWRIAPDSTTRNWIEQRIIDDAGILGHFVADGSNPHHTTKHHNGWVGDNPKGYTTDNRFHYRFEAQFVQANVALPDVVALVGDSARVLSDYRAGVLAYLDATFHQLVPLYELEKSTPFQAETTTAAQKAFATARLAAGAEMLRDIWWTAWITSGQTVPTSR